VRQAASVFCGSALARATDAYREGYLSWVNSLIGVWLVIAGIAIDRSACAIANDVAVGIFVFTVAIINAIASPRRGLR
jgi:hypothetical protein